MCVCVCSYEFGVNNSSHVSAAMVVSLVLIIAMPNGTERWPLLILLIIIIKQNAYS